MHEGRGDVTDGQSRAVLGLFDDPENAGDAIEALEEAGYGRRQVTVMSGSPYPRGAFGEEPEEHHLYRYPLIGAACGFAVGILVTVGTQLAYPLVTGGKPLLSIPPMFIIIYGGTLLGALVVTIFGILIELRLPTYERLPYDPRITEGYIGLLVARQDAGGRRDAAQLLRDAGAVDLVFDGGSADAA